MKLLDKRFYLFITIALFTSLSHISHANDTCQKPPFAEEFLQNIGCLYKGYASVKKFSQTGSKVAFVDRNGKITKPFTLYQEFNAQGNGLYSFKDPKTELYGFLDYQGNVLVPPQFYLIYAPHDNGIISVRSVEGKEGIVLNNDPRTIQFLYDFVHIDDKLPIAYVENNEKEGIIDKNGKTVLPLIYDDIKVSQEGMRTLQKNGKWGFVDDNFKVVIPFQYDADGWFNEGVAVVQKNGKYGVIDKQNNTLVAFNYDYIDEFKNGFTWAQLGNNYGIIDKKGTPSFAFQPDKIESATNGYYIIGKKGNQGLINGQGKTILEKKYQQVNFVEGNMVSFKQAGKWGLADTSGNILFPAKAKDSIIFMFGDPAKIVVNGKIQYINRQGKIVKK